MRCAPARAEAPLATVAELAEYVEQPVSAVEAHCRGAAHALAMAWRKAGPSTPSAIEAFYRDADEYLYDLTWWHALGRDDSANVQRSALKAALEHRARAALDFGSGIGSLGVLLAEAGMTVTLSDLNPRLNDYARWRFARRGLAVSFAAPTALPAEAFDFVSAIDVIEHVPNPEETLAMLASSLRPGGTLFLHLPTGHDDAFPMHFQHDAHLLLARLQEEGLWLEHEREAIFVLRRGETARYALQPGLELIPGDLDEHGHPNGGILFSIRPLMAMRLNAKAFALLSGLATERTASDAAARVPGLHPLDAAEFLESLAERRVLAKRPPVTGRWPLVSIIVAARGRHAATRACVNSLLALDYLSGRIEIIVIDDASEPPLAPVLSDLSVRLLRQECNIGQSAARNLAAAEARGDVLAFIDNDCVAEAAWLRNLIPYLTDPVVGIVGGRVMAPPPVGRVAAYEAVRSPLDMGAVGGAVGPDKPVQYLPTCNVVIRRDVMLAHGGFASEMRLGEDVDFIWRALQGGIAAVYAPAGRIIHHHRTSLGAFLRRRADYGSSEADLQQRHVAGRRRMLLPKMSLLLLAMLTVVSVSWLLGVTLGAAALALIALEYREKLRYLERASVRPPARCLRRALIREHAASLYHLSANVTRYYALPLIAAGLLWPPLLAATAALLLVAPVTDHRQLKPSLALPTFVGLYWLEMLAYQWGVWRGCLARRTLRPFLPAIRWGR